LEAVIKSKIPGIQSLISKTIAELEAELSRLGKPIAADDGVILVFIAPTYLNYKFPKTLDYLYGTLLKKALYFHPLSLVSLMNEVHSRFPTIRPLILVN